jgi:hypothetical protein
VELLTWQGPLNENVTFILAAPQIEANWSTSMELPLAVKGSLSKQGVEDISYRFVEPIFLRRIINWETSRSFNKALLPKLHGVLPKKYGQNKTINEHNTLYKLRSLRRLDLNENSRKYCVDCPLEVNSIKTEVDYLDPELTLNFSKLADPFYLDETKTKLMCNNHSKKFDNLNSWFYPNSTEDSNKRMETALAIVQYHANNFTIENLRQVIWSDVPLDLFQDMLLLDSPDERIRLCCQIFLNCITVESYPALVGFLRDTNSLLIQSKLAAIIAEALQSSRSKDILENLINKQG